MSRNYQALKKLLLETSDKKKTYIKSLLLKSGDYYETREYKFEVVRGVCATPKPRADNPSEIRREDSVYRSRKRLIRKVLSNSVPTKPLFFTFTYASNMEDYERAVLDTKALIDAMRTLWGKIEYLYVLERQKRGAWHVHMLIFFRSYLDIRAVRAIWQECIGERARVHVVPTNNSKHLAFYFAKYMGKDGREGNKRSYTCSKGLKNPVEIINYHLIHDLKLPKEVTYESVRFLPKNQVIKTTIYYDDQRTLSWL